jgi:hypothetical protein
VIAKGGFFNGNVVKIRENSASQPRPLVMLEERRAAAAR